MNGFGHRYVVDTNTLSQLGKHRRTTAFFLNNAVIPSEVLHEAQSFPDIRTLQKNLHPTTSQVLEWLAKIMATVPADDTKLINLYANKGGADPLVVACALDGQAQDSQYLDAAEWVVVTGDDALRDKAKEFGLKVLSNAEFTAVIDASENQGADEELHASSDLDLENDQS